MNDVIITYDADLNSEENLRYIIRNIEKNCTHYNEIVLVGDRPEWIQGVVHIGFSGTERKYALKNQYNKLRAACMSGITKGFYWVDADDLLVPFNAIKALRCSTRSDSGNILGGHTPKGTEKISKKHTQDLMRRRGFDMTHDYFNKVPMSFSTEKVMNTFYSIDFETKWGYCIKTLYANFNRLKPTSSVVMPEIRKNLTTKSSYERH